MIILTAIKSHLLNAGPKAQNDIVKILSEDPKYGVKSREIIGEPGILWNIKRGFLIFRSLFSKDIILVQHPITQSRIMRLLPANRTIIFIHDLNFIRFPEDPKNKKEIRTLKHFHYIIAHNSSMKNYLVNKGIQENVIYTNEIFDYCCLKSTGPKHISAGERKVIFAGNLEKSDFIYQLSAECMDFELELYGQGLRPFENKKISYSGVFQPDHLPEEWQGNIGLVWDGNLDESDEDYGMKRYTKYNSPHKLSCYLAAGIPVIAWRGSAIAEFVLKNDIGYLIKSIYDINTIDFSDYDIKRKNVEDISQKVRTGYYTKRVIKSVIQQMKKVK